MNDPRTAVLEREESQYTINNVPTGRRFVRSERYERLRARFQELSKRWHDETDGMSSIHRKLVHPAYLEILTMGESVVPLILEELARRPGHWFNALNILVKFDPVPKEHYGDMEKVIEDWLEYGRNKKLI